MEESSASTKTPRTPTVARLKYIQRYKWIKQTVFVLCYVYNGIAASMFGPSLVDLTERFNSDEAEMAAAIGFTTPGSIIGALLGSVIFANIPQHTDAILGVTYLFNSTLTIARPFAGTPLVFAIIHFSVSLTSGILEMGNHMSVFSLWGDEAASPVHSLHFGYGVGSIIGPQITWPFLAPQKDETVTSAPTSTEISNLVNSTSIDATTILDSVYETGQSRVEIPYIICGGLAITLSLTFFGFYLEGYPKELPERCGIPLSLKMCSPHLCSPGNPMKAVGILTLLLMFYFTLVGSEISIVNYIFTYLTSKKNPFDNATAALLNSAYFASFSTGRGIAIFISKFVSPDRMLLAYATNCVLMTSILAAFAYNSNIVLWTFMILLGFSLSVLFPGGMAFTNVHLDMNAMAIFIFQAGAMTGGSLFPFIAGVLFKHEKDKEFMYLIFGVTSTMATFYYLTLAFTKYMERKKETSVSCSDINVTQVTRL